MAEDVETLTLDHLKHFNGRLERIERKLGEHTDRLADLEGGQAAIIQHPSVADAARQLVSDRLEHRLELTN